MGDRIPPPTPPEGPYPEPPDGGAYPDASPDTPPPPPELVDAVGQVDGRERVESDPDVEC